MTLLDPQITAAAFGAAVAFVLMRIGQWLTAWHGQVDRNYRHLLRLEVIYRQYLIDLSGLRVRVVAISEKQDPVAAVIIGLPSLPEVDLPSSDIQSLDLLNSLATHWTLVRKLNADLASAANARALLGEGIKSLSGAIDTDKLFKSYVKTLNDVSPFISELEGKTQGVIATILVLAQGARPAFARFFDKRHPRWAGKLFTKKVDAELVVLRKELDQCNAKRKSEIETTSNETGLSEQPDGAVTQETAQSAAP